MSVAPIRLTAEQEPANVEVAIFRRADGTEVRVHLADWRGDRRVDLRQFRSKGEGELKATRLGVVLSIDSLPQLIDALQRAEQQAVRMGWLTSREPQPSRWAMTQAAKAPAGTAKPLWAGGARDEF